MLAISAAVAICVAGCGGGSAVSGSQVTAEANEGTGGAEAQFRSSIDQACLEIERSFAEAKWNEGAVTAQGAMGIAGLESHRAPAGMARAYSRLVEDLKKRELARSFVVVGPSIPEYDRAVREYRLYTARAEADAGELRLRHCPFPLAPPGHPLVEPQR